MNLVTQLNEVLSSLEPRSAEVLRMRFGLDDGSSKTLKEIGVHFNVTSERIRHIEAKALRMLRHPSRARLLKDYLVKKKLSEMTPADKLLRAIFGQ